MQLRQEGLSERGSRGPEKASNLSAAKGWLGHQRLYREISVGHENAGNP